LKVASETQTAAEQPPEEKTAMTVKPLSDRLLVKRVHEETKTPGGLVIPDTAKEKPQQGLVMAVGSGKRQDDGSLRTPAVQTGDTVLFGKYSGNDIKIDGEEHLILSEDDVLAVLEQGAEQATD
jgi:chaperonin GroES